MHGITHEFPPAERAKFGRLGGLASGRARRAKLGIKAIAISELEKASVVDQSKTAGEVITESLSRRAQQGDAESARLLAEMAGVVA